jgi:hypothetical protein
MRPDDVAFAWAESGAIVECMDDIAAQDAIEDPSQEPCQPSADGAALRKGHLATLFGSMMIAVWNEVSNVSQMKLLTPDTNVEARRKQNKNPHFQILSRLNSRPIGVTAREQR